MQKFKEQLNQHSRKTKGSPSKLRKMTTKSDEEWTAKSHGLRATQSAFWKTKGSPSNLRKKSLKILMKSDFGEMGRAPVLYVADPDRLWFDPRLLCCCPL